MSIAQESSGGSIDTSSVGAWKAWKDSAHCQSLGITTADVNSYESQAVDNIYSCSGEKGRRDFCFEHGTLLFHTRRGCFLSLYSISLVCLSLLRPKPTHSFLFFPPNPFPTFLALFSWRNQRPGKLAAILTIEPGLFRESQEGENDSQGARN